MDIIIEPGILPYANEKKNSASKELKNIREMKLKRSFLRAQPDKQENRCQIGWIGDAIQVT